VRERKRKWKEKENEELRSKNELKPKLNEFKTEEKRRKKEEGEYFGGSLVELEKKMKLLAEKEEPEDSQLISEMSAFSHWKTIEETLGEIELSFSSFSQLQTTLMNSNPKDNSINLDEIILQRNEALNLYLKQVENLLPFNGFTFVLRHLNSFLHLQFSVDISTQTLSIKVIGLTGTLKEENCSVSLLLEDKEFSTSTLKNGKEILWNENFSFHFKSLKSSLSIKLKEKVKK
jgi:hypothetical protein